jgi:ATP phosphoribosyltransferase regulatory subunit
MGRELEDRVYRFIDREGNQLALRPEFTSLLAKIAATRLSSEPTPIRLAYSGEVLRFERPKGGQQREFAQAGIEHYGGSTWSADVEVLLVCMEALEKLGIEDFQINLGSVDFFGGIVDSLALSPDRVDELKALLSRKDQTGLDRLIDEMDVGSEPAGVLRSIPHLTGSGEILEQARGLTRNGRSGRAIAHLASIYAIFVKLGKSDRLTIDLGEIRGFDYYTGILFRAYVPGLGFEVASGGRYDGLPAQFGYDAPAVGFSFTLERLEQVVADRLDAVRPPDAVPVEPGAFEDAVRLRREGKVVRICS